MFEAIVIALREGVEAALVLAIALNILARRNLSHLARAMFAGAGAAVILSAIAATYLTRLTYNEELAEGVTYLVGAALVFSLVYWMWRAAPRMKEEVETVIDRASASRLGGIAVFLFGFGMVFREGLETAVFLTAVRFNTEGVGVWIGAGIGLAMAVVFGVLLIRGLVRIPLKPFFAVTTLVLALLGLQMVVAGLHELSEAGVIPASKTEMAIIGPIVKNELLLFTVTIAIVAGWMLFAPAARTFAEPATAAARRLDRAARAGDAVRRRWTGGLGLVVVALLTTAFVQSTQVPERSAASPVELTNGTVVLPTDPLSDGNMHFFEAELPEGPVRFFVLQAGDELHTCFDGCEICGDVGYYQEGHEVICRNCTSPIPLYTLGRKGGCNPIPLTSRIEGADLIVDEAALREGLQYAEGR